jgi:hypothetical protein
MNQDGWDWCSGIVHAFFSLAVVNQILQLPIARHGGEDITIWPFTKHSKYIVRLAYYFARSNKFFQAQGIAGKGNTSDAKTFENIWKAIWRIKVSGKMLIHLWWFAHNLILLASS